ncbi:hypothetical protein MAM1_0208d08023 [Mucor ambiguus]|uniref:Uncharacterized protein n=1 Tax=Mucor ambiguus TaxID=91626 RepID=A0A0C9MLT5_9FUNG|nr:hypothetical protein MAM1_0208d08023 [Mucor ambiguus]
MAQVAKQNGQLESNSNSIGAIDATIVELQNLVRKIPTAKFNGPITDYVATSLYADSTLTLMLLIADQNINTFCEK